MGKTKEPIFRFKGYTDDWEQRKFHEVFDGLQNNTLSRSDMNYDGGEAQNLHYGDVLIKFGDYIDVSMEQLPYISDKSITNKFSNSYLQDGDIVIADTAEDETVGKCTEIVGTKGKKLIAGLHTIPCRPRQTYAPKFLGYYMNSNAYHAQLIPLMQGIKVTSISKGALQSTDMIIPASTKEQGKIGTAIDNLITLHQRKSDALKELKKGMLQKMFPKEGAKIPEFRFKGFTGDWEKRKFGDKNHLITGYPFESEKYVEERITLIRGMNVKRGTLDLSDEICMKWGSSEGLENYLLEDGDILIQMDGALIGKSYAKITQNQLPALLVQRVTRARAKKDIADTNFMYQTIQRNFLSYIKLNKTETAVPHLSLNDIRDFTIMVPTLEEQRQIGEYFNNLDNLITLHQRKSDALKELKKGMLQKMFV